MPLESNTNSEKLEVNSLSAHVTWLLFTNKHSILMIDIYLQTFRSFQPTFRFHMPFLNFKARIISAHQIEQSWCLETYKLFVPALKQLAHPLFSSYSVRYADSLSCLKQASKQANQSLLHVVFVPNLVSKRLFLSIWCDE